MTLTHEYLTEILHYNPETGEWRWRIDIWRSRISAGMKAGCIQHNKKTGKSYLRIKIDGICYSGHRLAYFYMTGKWPSQLIDHEDGDGLNNKWENIRDANYQQSNRNRKTPGNLSGYKNVSSCGKDKWRVRFKVGGKLKHIGTFEDLELAAFVASEYRDKYHGEFANHD